MIAKLFTIASPLAIMSDFQYCSIRKAIVQPSTLNFMVLCCLLKILDLKASGLLPAYQQIIQDNTIDGLKFVLATEIEYRAVFEVTRLLNPKWKLTLGTQKQFENILSHFLLLAPFMPGHLHFLVVINSNQLIKSYLLKIRWRKCFFILFGIIPAE